MQMAISEGAALRQASSAWPSAWMGVGVKTAFSTLLCACARERDRATSAMDKVADGEGLGLSFATIRIP